MPVLTGREVRVFLLRLVYAIALVGLGGDESGKRMGRKMSFRLGRVLEVQGCCGDGDQKRRCECPSLPFMMFTNSASTQDEGMNWYRKEGNGIC
jgi:hypothetical protein